MIRYNQQTGKNDPIFFIDLLSIFCNKIKNEIFVKFSLLFFMLVLTFVFVVLIKRVNSP